MFSNRPATLLLIAAALLMAPSLVLGTLPSASSIHNLTWAQQFSQQFRSGDLYPRWMADSFEGLGAPTFYFYPPASFWADALLSVVTFNVLSTSHRLAITSMLLLWASGLAMYGWLNSEKVGRRVALVGAIGYMAAPYHLVDHYIRGALAEFAAYAVLPLVMWGIALVASRRLAGIALLPVAYASLVLSHLPTALLITVTAVPAYVLFCVWRAGKHALGVLVRCALCGALGLGLSAIYLLPALSLQDAISAEHLWARGYRVEDGFLITSEQWIQPLYLRVILSSISGAWCIAAVGVLVARSKSGGHAGKGQEALLWALVSLVCLSLLSGLVPWFWTLVPMVSKVQFPWRLMIVVEFAAVTALCLVIWPPRDRVIRTLLGAAIVVLASGVAVIGDAVAHRVSVAAKGEFMAPQDAREYLPTGYPLPVHAGYTELGLQPLEKLPLISCVPIARLCRADNGPFGMMRITIDSDQPTRVVLRRFYFPAWGLDQPLPIVPTDPLRLVSFTAPEGHRTYRLQRHLLAAEERGWTISGLSLVLLLAWTTAGRANRFLSRP